MPGERPFSDGGRFTSDLSVSEFVLTRDAGCRPIAQVMGSSVYYIGQIADYKGQTGELQVISDGHRASRRAAVQRLTAEAARLDADAVIGVRLNERMITMGQRGKGGDDGGEVLEFTAVGTAVRAPWLAHPPGQPVMTDLSGQDLWALRQAGYDPCGFLFEFCRYHVYHVTRMVGTGDGEMERGSQGVERAREIAASRLLEGAVACGAEFVVGSALEVQVREVPCGYRRCQGDDLEVDVSWFGTGIRRSPGAGVAAAGLPPRLLSLTPLGRRRDVVVDAEDDREDIRFAAEQAEEAALEADLEADEI